MTRAALVAAAPVLALVFGLAGPAAAESQLERDMREMEQIARGAAEQFIGSFQRMLEKMPQYGLPEMTEDGDIIIRRRAPGTPAPERRAPPRRHGTDEPLRDGHATDI